MSYVTGSIIKELRERKGYTQRQLAESVCVSDKTVSKWETGKGLPDVGIITELASALGVSLAELLNGEYAENRNRSGNMKKISFYVCPLCGNVIQAMGNGSYSCCGILLPAMEPEEECAGHEIQVRDMDGEFYVCMEHEMDKTHYLSFLVYATSSHVQFVKLYPEQSAEARFTKRGHGFIYACCNRHGLYRKNV